MEKLNELGETISTTPTEEMALDSHIKNILAFKPILSRIIKETVEECRDMDYSDIEKCIEGEVDIDIVGVNPGTTNTSKIEGRQQEDAVNGEGKVTFDIRTVLLIRNEQIGIKLLLDVEIQKDDSPGYDIIERAIYYCCRMISAQLGTEFTNQTNDPVKYGNLKKVYSIWVCTDVPQKRANTIETYKVSRNVYPKKKDDRSPRFDLMEAVIVNISKKRDAENTDSNLIRILTDLFDEKKSSSEKADILENQYGIKITDEIEEEVGNMTAYAANLIKKGRAEGEAKGRAEGIAEGEAKGRAEGIAEGEAKKEAEFLQKLLESNQSKEFILGLGFTENEYQKAEKAFSEKEANSKQE